jgi:AcrR family transcriptional regulator
MRSQQQMSGCRQLLDFVLRLMVSEYLLRATREPKPLQPANKKTPTSNGATANGARMAGDERRLQILRIAMRLFSQRGFGGTTTKEIAVAAGVSEAMVFRHFATKKELYSAILDHKACLHDTMDPVQVVAEAMVRKDDRAVFEGLALDALDRHDCDPEFHRLLLHSALEEHELAQMFWEKFVTRVYRVLGAYIRERQRDGAIFDVEPLVIVRAFVGMVIHHSLNNNLWDRKRMLLKISNQVAAREFANILMHGVARGNMRRAPVAPTTFKSDGKSGAAGKMSTRAATVQTGMRLLRTGRKGNQRERDRGK